MTVFHRGSWPSPARTFLLIHGAGLGSWCWRYLEPRLKMRGHCVLTVDLPIEDLTAGAAAYARVCEDALRQARMPGGVVVVAASMAGLVAPLIDHHDVIRTVYVDAVLPVPGTALADRREDVFSERYFDDFLPRLATTPGGLTRWPAAAAVEAWFGHCDPLTARWAASKVRGQSPKVFTETTPLAAWPDGPLTYIRCSDSPTLNSDWQDRAASELLGVEPVVMDSDHSPFLSHPERLAALLHRAVQETPDRRSVL
ncbi:alpha/beta hydrolase [Streptomyces sp. NPDC098781]|uniref:alpha/beta hydrolase n=1 Tax=Streptomyces sp. NPDC098781 TaxID=3366097 RepID=UPI0038115663